MDTEQVHLDNTTQLGQVHLEFDGYGLHRSLGKTLNVFVS